MKNKKGNTTEEQVDVLESNDVSAVFSSHYNTGNSPLENKKIAGLIQHFVILLQRSLSAFLGKKMDLVFDSIRFATVQELNIEKTPYVLSSIRFTPQNLAGLIFFDYAFIHTVIDILFGAGIYKSNTVISTLGNSGIVIAEKVSELCMTALQEAISEYEQIQIALLKTTEQSGLILNQPLSDQYFDLAFHADFNGMNCQLHIAVPDALLEDLALQDSVEPIQNQEKSTVKNTLRKDIIESTVTLVASLQDIKVKISDILNLKAGDCIPIYDPTVVYLSHDQKKIFKATVGQSESQRVVKILDTL